MRALVYHGPMDVRIDDKPKPKIEQPQDVILKLIKTAICGSDLHLYHGTCRRNGAQVKLWDMSLWVLLKKSEQKFTK